MITIDTTAHIILLVMGVAVMDAEFSDKIDGTMHVDGLPRPRFNMPNGTLIAVVSVISSLDSSAS